VEELTAFVARSFETEPSIKLAYFSINNAVSLVPVQEFTIEPCRAFIAAVCGSVRLIDNVAL
jgi:pantothenate synthetase